MDDYIIKDSICDEKILTVIIPAYNMEKYLERCCDSLILDDNFDMLEVLIINDGSDDATSEIAHSFQERYPNVFRVIDKENGNYGSCINRGLAEAKGYFVKTLDADDMFENSYLGAFINHLLEIKTDFYNGVIVDLIISDMNEINQNGDILNKKEFSFQPRKYSSLNISQLKDFEKMTQHCVTYRTEILRDMNYYQTEGISYSDQEWVRIPLLAVKTFVYHPQVLYLYTQGREGQTMEKDTYIKNTWMQILIKKDMLLFYKENASLYPAVNQQIFFELLCLNMEKLYSRFLLLNREQLKVEDLIKFDSFIKTNYNEYYNELNSMVYSPRFPVKYISYWRDTAHKWKYEFIYRVFYTLRKIKRQLLKEET